MHHQFYQCHHCGNLATLLQDAGIPLFCCGEPMHPITPDTVTASQEKHRPVYTTDHNTVHVTVGAEEHPMTPEHYIQWICLESRHTLQFASLIPSDRPMADFALCDGDSVTSVCAFCNQHQLWRN